MKNLTPRAKNALILLALSIVAVIGFWFAIVPAIFAHKSDPVSVPSVTASPSPSVTVSGSAGVNLTEAPKPKFVAGGWVEHADGEKAFFPCSSFLEGWKHYDLVCVENGKLPDSEKRDYLYEIETGKLFASPYGDLRQPEGAWQAFPELIAEDGKTPLLKGDVAITPEQQKEISEFLDATKTTPEDGIVIPQSSTVIPAIPSLGEEPVTVTGSSSPSPAPAPVVQKSMSVAVAPAPSVSAPAVVEKSEPAPVAMAVATAPAPAPSASAPASSVVIPEATYPTKTQVICPLSVNAMEDPTNGKCVIIYTDKIQFPSEGFRNTVWICPSNINPLQQPTNGSCAVSYYNGVKK